MNIPKEAIEKAIDGGWSGPERWDGGDNTYTMSWQEIIMESSFWQALGKSLGWAEPYRSGATDDWVGRYEYPKYARRFYDLILTNGDTDVYWKEILK